MALNELSLNFYCCSSLTDDVLYLISDALHKLPSITDLEFNFNGCIKLTDSGISQLSTSLVGSIGESKNFEY